MFYQGWCKLWWPKAEQHHLNPGLDLFFKTSREATTARLPLRWYIFSKVSLKIVLQVQRYSELHWPILLKTQPLCLPILQITRCRNQFKVNGINTIRFKTSTILPIRKCEGVSWFIESAVSPTNVNGREFIILDAQGLQSTASQTGLLKERSPAGLLKERSPAGGVTVNPWSPRWNLCKPLIALSRWEQSQAPPKWDTFYHQTFSEDTSLTGPTSPTKDFMEWCTSTEGRNYQTTLST
jgi:hypothetical protein